MEEDTLLVDPNLLPVAETGTDSSSVHGVKRVKVNDYVCS